MPHDTHTAQNPGRSLPWPVIAAMAAVLSVATAFTVDATAGDAAADANARYHRERVACTSGNSQQDRATCLKEAGAARDEARGGRLGTGPATTEANATARCEALPAKDRNDCIARIQGAGTTSGSVRDGGIYRELVTRTPAPPAAALPATPPSAPQE